LRRPSGEGWRSAGAGTSPSPLILRRPSGEGWRSHKFHKVENYFIF
jgi:hypothetical protein